MFFKFLTSCALIFHLSKHASHEPSLSYDQLMTSSHFGIHEHNDLFLTDAPKVDDFPLCILLGNTGNIRLNGC